MQGHNDQAPEDNELLAQFVAREKLPEPYLETARHWFLPLAEEIKVAVDAGRVRVLGIVGTQGSGKSTLAALLEALLERRYGLRVATLSLDDFYLTRKERQELAGQVHPLLITRGVPGTHDVSLAIRTIDALLSHRGETAIPRFDKSRDERRPVAEWDRVAAPVDLVILEGWCLGAEAQTSEELAEPINELERNEDRDRRWRDFANQSLGTEYPKLFQLIDKMILLEAPDFDCVYLWRHRQEQQLPAGSGDRIMSERELERFVQHFERITRHSLGILPRRADVVFKLDASQHIVQRYGSGF